MKTPIRVISVDNLHGNRYTHESWAKITVSQVHGHASLFGSDVKHNNYFALRITPCDAITSLGRVSYFAGNRPYIEVKLSASQMLEMFTSAGTGGGPCATLSFLNGATVPQAEDSAPTSSDEAKKDFARVIAETQKDINELSVELEELFSAKKPINAEQRKRTLQVLEKMRTHFASNTSFYLSQFQNATEVVVQQAKAEVESYIQTTLIAKGVESLNMRPVTMTLGEHHD